MSEAILVTRDGPIATVVLNNPDRLNALTRAAWTRPNDVMDELSAADEVRCIVVRGAGDAAFAAGADISEFPAQRADAVQAKVYGEAVSGGEFGDVGAGGEGRVSGAADDDATHLVRRRQRVHHIVQARPGGPGQRVQPVRVVEDHGGDGAVPADEDRFGHGIAGSLAQTPFNTRRVSPLSQP